MNDAIFPRLALVALTLLGACKRESGGRGETAKAASSSAAPKEGQLTLLVAYGSEKKSWFEDAMASFRAANASGPFAGVRFDARAMGSGEAMQAILDGTLKPHVFSPASGAYITVLNQRWLSIAGRTKPISPAGEPVVLSPIVIAMWKPMAEALGWPAKALGWKDLLRVSASPEGWKAFDHPEWGAFKLGHTHPEYSNSGLLAVLAEAYAGAKKTRGLSAADLASKDTQALVDSIERTIVHYGQSTGFFADKMRERGPSYVSAAVLYENLVIESYSKAPPPPEPLVAIYPIEGTFWSDHPYAILDAPWVGAKERAAAEAFLAHLKSKPVQAKALTFGFRPADTAIPIGQPVDAAHGVDPKQPQTLLEVPDALVLDRLIELWQSKKKSADVILVFDKSGSMSGRPLAEAKSGAKAFLQMLKDRDRVSLMAFDNNLYPPTPPAELKAARAGLIQAVDQIQAGGGTALYDAIAQAYDLAQKAAEKEPDRIHAVVVMTDGRDEHSRLKLDMLKSRFPGGESPVRVFAIAYGTAADRSVLDRIAEMAKGTSAVGTAETIVKTYRDMATFF